MNWKRTGVLLIVLSFFLVGYQCQSDNMVSVIGAMAAGDGVGYMLNKHAPNSVDQCEAAFDKLMQDTIVDNVPIDPIPSENMIRYYNESLAIISKEYKDPYYITSYLGALMTQLGAQYTPGPDPTVIAMQPVPRPLMLSFENGYDIGKRRWEDKE